MFRALADRQRQRQHAKHHGQGGHQDGAQPHLGRHQQRFVAGQGGFAGAVVTQQAFAGADGEVEQQNRIFCDQAHQHDDANHREHGQRGAKHHQRQYHANQGERQRGHEGQRLQKAFELAGQNHVDEDDGHGHGDDGVLKRLFHVFG